MEREEVNSAIVNALFRFPFFFSFEIPNLLRWRQLSTKHQRVKRSSSYEKARATLLDEVKTSVGRDLNGEKHERCPLFLMGGQV